MRLSYVIMFAAIGLWLAAGSTVCGLPPVPRGEGVHVDVEPGGVHVQTPGVRIGEPSGMARATDLIGLKVCNAANENLGTIENLVLDASSGTIRYAVLSFGTTLGMGGKLIAIPWQQLRLAPKETSSAGMQEPQHFVLDVPKEVLTNAPGFEKDHWPNFADRTWSVEIERYFNTHRAARRAVRESQPTR